MNRRHLLLAAGAATAGLGFARSAAAQGTAPAVAINGAGATFPAPVYAKWGEAAGPATGVRLNYSAVGSGGGQNQIRNRTVDFGASDAPMSAADLASANLLQFPTVMGAVVVIVNVPGIAVDQLKLTGDVVADLFQGRITRWNDARLVASNPGVTLPNIAVAPAYRADASGTSFVFTSYLAAVSDAWKSAVGAGTSVSWPAGTGARGNDGVAEAVRSTRGAIGYVENAYATQNHLVTVMLRNQAGQFVKPETASYQAAAANADWSVANFAANLVNTAGAASWPIVSPTFILLPKNPTDAAKSAAVMRFFDWAYRNGAALATGLDYMPLPAAVQEQVRAAWAREVRGPNGQPIPMAR